MCEIFILYGKKERKKKKVCLCGQGMGGGGGGAAVELGDKVTTQPSMSHI